jgi:hypothetical protein
MVARVCNEGVAGDVDRSASRACWSVEERAWQELRPDLPEEVTALLAAPVVVSAEPRRLGPEGP